MHIDHLSVSRKGVIDECEVRYLLQYHARLPAPGPEKPWFAYGHRIHAIAEHYVKLRGTLPLAAVVEAVECGAVPVARAPDGSPIRAEPLHAMYRGKFPQHLQALQWLFNRIGVDAETEVPFAYDLDSPHGRQVVGFIDHLQIRPGGGPAGAAEKFALLVDFKTTQAGKYRKTRETIGQDLQLRTYARIVSLSRGIPAANITAALFYVDGGEGGNGELLPARFSQESLLAAEAELLACYRRIEGLAPQDARPNVGEACRNCDYKTLCFFAPRKRKLTLANVPAAI